MLHDWGPNKHALTSNQFGLASVKFPLWKIFCDWDICNIAGSMQQVHVHHMHSSATSWAAPAPTLATHIPTHAKPVMETRRLCILVGEWLHLFCGEALQGLCQLSDEHGLMLEVTLCPSCIKEPAIHVNTHSSTFLLAYNSWITKLLSGAMMTIICRYSIHGWLVQVHVLDKSEQHCEPAMGCSPLQTRSWLFDKCYNNSMMKTMPLAPHQLIKG